MKKTITITVPAQTFNVEIDVDGTAPPVTPPVNPPEPPVISPGFKLGANGFPWFPLHLLKGIGIDWMRCYFATGWGYEPDGLSMQPLNQAWTKETNGMDDLLLRAKSMGMNIVWCNHQTPEWFRNTGRSDGNNDYAPISVGSKRDAAASFKWYAEYMWQLVARYGAVKYHDTDLIVDSSPRWTGDENYKKSGLNILKYIETWNEEKWWLKGTEAYLEPETMAALMSATYDGHEGTLGAKAGIKTADPSIVVIMPGLTDYDFDYIAKMSAWFLANRKDKKWPCDIFNLHHYSNRGNKPKQHPAQWVMSGGCPPSEDANFDTVKELIAFAKSLGMPFWMTECGYDTKAPSNMHIVGKNGQTDEQAQASALIETIKKYKEYGADAVFVFTGPDDIGNGQFTKSGIFTREADGYRPKPAATAIKAYLEGLTPKARFAKKPFEVSMAASKRPN